MKSRELKTGSDVRTIKAEIRDQILTAIIDGESFEGPLLRTSHGEGLWRVNGDAYHVVASEHDGKIWAAVNGNVYVFEDARAQDEMGAGGASENSVAAPMPGKVIKVLVSEGDHVEEGQQVIIVEAMKMEHTLHAPKEGKVGKLACEEGQQVDAGIPLIEIEDVE